MMKKINPKETALIVVDMQNKFCSPSGFFAKIGMDISPMSSIVNNLTKFIEILKKKGVIIFYTKQIENHKDSPENIKNLFRRQYKEVTPHITKNNFEGKFYGVAPKKGDIIIEKKTWDAFSNPLLDKILKKKKIKYIIIAGIYTNVCVESTARRAFTEGYEVIIPKDLVAVSGHNMALHHASLKTMNKYVAEVASSKDILKAIGG